VDDLLLPLDAFVRSVGITSTSSHAFLIGAGASMSSGVPTAYRCIWEWKRQIFLTNNHGLEKEFGELSLPSVQDRIQRWLDSRGFPPRDDPSEYGDYIERCYPIAEHRRRYFERLVQRAKPHIGYRLLCLLAQDHIVRSVWTTNFDGLTARAAADSSLTPVEIGFDCRERVVRQPARGELLCVSLHGDYRYDKLKNTEQELLRQDEVLRAALTSELTSTSLIVTGYSGRDASVMDALNTAYCQAGTGALYWCGHGDGDPPVIVTDLLRTARKHGRIAHYVPAQGFDDLLIRLALHCLTGEHLKRAQQIIAESAPDRTIHFTPFSVPPGGRIGIVKSNCYPIRCPSDVLAFQLEGLPEKQVWKYLRDQVEGRDIVAVPLRGKIVALGNVDAIKDLFGGRIRGAIERTSIDERDFRYDDSAIVSLLQTTLLQCFAKRPGLRTAGKRLVWDTNDSQSATAGGKRCFRHSAAILALRQIAGQPYLVIKPTVAFTDAQGALLPEEDVRAEKLAILGYQHNDKFNSALKKWADRLFPPGQETMEFPSACGSTFRFVVGRSPLVAGIVNPSDRKDRPLPAAKVKLINQSGVQLPEPPLVFAHKSDLPGWIHDTHPVRGILENRPYDFSLTRRGLADHVAIGVVCPMAEQAMFDEFLQNLHRIHEPQPKERDYLLPFPGFASAFGLPLQLPKPGEGGWATCPEPALRLGEKEGSIELARNIKTSIDSIRASGNANLVMVCIPERWSHWRGYETETERLDLHDYVKAYCVHRGIPTQFLEEDTLQNTYDCRIAWWLSLALYVKSMRTPWVLDSLAPGTAFVGLGFSIDRKAAQGQHVVVGCSHIYSERGEGLQYRLGKIDNPIIRGKNPFLSLEDARRVGNDIRQLFFDAMLKLPERVVIHKRTPFSRDEREGLVQGLAGITAIDMIEIGIEDNIRYIASKFGSQGELLEDSYPIRRGTTVLLDKTTALLWGHGVTTAVNAQQKYYQGKRRIPAPLLLRRHLGATPLEVLCGEILGLSKMDWNTFDMYARLPATIQSSNEIARIGSLLERFGRSSYDYRLFM
jgi:hypothetical protein